MDQHARRIHELCAELGDLEVQKRQLAANASRVALAIEEKHREIDAAVALRVRALGSDEGKG